MNGPDVVRAIFDAFEFDPRLQVLVLANEGLIVETDDGQTFRVEVVSHP